jgi:hypothetical protein
MDKEEVRATIPMPITLRDRIKALGRLQGRPFNAHALFMLKEATDKEERKVQKK